MEDTRKSGREGEANLGLQEMVHAIYSSLVLVESSESTQEKKTEQEELYHSQPRLLHDGVADNVENNLQYPQLSVPPPTAPILHVVGDVPFNGEVVIANRREETTYISAPKDGARTTDNEDVSSIFMVDSCEMSESEQSIPILRIFTLSSPQRCNIYWVRVSICSGNPKTAGVVFETCRALLDTGSDISFVTPRLLNDMSQHIVRRPLLEQEIRSYRTAGNQLIYPTECVVLWCKFGNTWEHHRFAIIDIDESMVCFDSYTIAEKKWLTNNFPQAEENLSPRPPVALGLWLDKSDKDGKEARRKHASRQSAGVVRAQEFLQHGKPASSSSGSSSAVSNGTGRSSTARSSNSSHTEYSTVSASTQSSK